MEPETGHYETVDELIQAHEMMLRDANKAREDVLDYNAVSETSSFDHDKDDDPDGYTVLDPDTEL